MTYYKVVTEELKSLGLRRNPNIMTFKIGKWIKEKNPIIGNSDNGGIWVANGKGNARTLLLYMQFEKGIKCKIFRVEIGEILYTNSYRTKTDKVKLIEEI